MSGAWNAGDRVNSGIYSVRHKGEHTHDHEVTCVSGKTFPSCNECGAEVCFVLVRHATYIRRHEQFKSGASPR